MAPLVNEIRPLNRDLFPPHLGPPIPEISSIWFKIFVYHVTGSGPPSLLLPKGNINHTQRVSNALINRFYSSYFLHFFYQALGYESYRRCFPSAAAFWLQLGATIPPRFLIKVLLSWSWTPSSIRPSLSKRFQTRCTTTTQIKRKKIRPAYQTMPMWLLFHFLFQV